MANKVRNVSIVEMSDDQFKKLIIDSLSKRVKVIELAGRYGVHRECISRRVVKLFGVSYQKLTKGSLSTVEQQELYNFYDPRDEDYEQLISQTEKSDPEHARWMRHVVEGIKQRDLKKSLQLGACV